MQCDRIEEFLQRNKIKGYSKLNYFELVNLLRDFFEGNSIKPTPQPKQISDLLHDLKVFIQTRKDADDNETLSTLVKNLIKISLYIEDFLNLE